MIGRPTAAVTSEISLQLVVPGDASVPLPVSLRYEAGDPYAVHATFRTGRGEGVEWVFARELLAAGSLGPAGEGDVRVWPGEHHGEPSVFVALTSPDGEALLAAPAEELTSFVQRTYGTVPPGAESRHVDVDSALVQLLAG